MQKHSLSRRQLTIVFFATIGIRFLVLRCLLLANAIHIIHDLDDAELRHVMPAQFFLEPDFLSHRIVACIRSLSCLQKEFMFLSGSVVMVLVYVPVAYFF